MASPLLGIGTLPVLATVLDSKLSYTEKPKTNGYPDPPSFGNYGVASARQQAFHLVAAGGDRAGTLV